MLTPKSITSSLPYKSHLCHQGSDVADADVNCRAPSIGCDLCDANRLILATSRDARLVLQATPGARASHFNERAAEAW